MNPEEKELLEKTAALAEENNKILRGMRRANRWNLAWKIFYWVVIIALSYSAYVYVQPYLDEIMKAYEGIKGASSNIQKAGSNLPDFSQFFN